MLRFSIILPVYNGCKYLKESIASVLDQSYRNYELIIVDDGSTDGSVDIIEKFKRSDQRIKYIYKDHSGLSKTLNLGLQNAHGKYIARIDADDLWFPDKLLKQNEILLNNPRFGIIGTSIEFIDSGGETISDLKGFNDGMEYKDDELIRRMLRNNLLCSSSLVYRRDLMDEIGSYKEALLTSMDYDFSVRALSCADGIILSDTLVKYRITANMMTVRLRSRMIKESISVRVSACRLFNPSIGIKFGIIRDVISLCVRGIITRFTGGKRFSDYRIKM